MRKTLFILCVSIMMMSTTECGSSVAVLAGVKPLQLFPDSCSWNQPVLGLPLEDSSAAIIRNTVWLTDDHRGNVGTDGAYPVNIVNNAPMKARLTFRDGYNCQEDYPDSVPFFNGMAVQDGAYLDDPNHDTEKARDHHLILLDTGTRKLYEFYQPRPTTPGTWYCEGGAMWDLTKCQQRVPGTTSADAAGLPLLPLLITPAEMQAGEIHHALRITVAGKLREYICPAVHQGCFMALSGYYMPMWTRIRLRSTFDTSAFRRDVKVILKCLMTYGAIVADNGNNFSITYVRDDAMQQFGEHYGDNGDGTFWHSINLNDTTPAGKPLTAFDFEVLKMGQRFTGDRAPCK